MSKIKLKIRHILDNKEDDYIVTAIKQENKYIYNHNNIETKIIKDENRIAIINNSDIINEMHFDVLKPYGFIIIDNQKINYDFELIKLIILDKKIEIDYKLDSLNKFILEEIDG